MYVRLRVHDACYTGIMDSIDGRGSNMGQWLTVTTVTPEEVRKIERFFFRGHSNNSAHEELVLDIIRKLRPLKIKKDNHESIAVLVKILTTGRTIDEAREYLRLEEGTRWRKC
jgi:hypothetical protein